MIINEYNWACSQEGKEREGRKKKKKKKKKIAHNNSRNYFIEKIEMYTKLWAR